MAEIVPAALQAVLEIFVAVDFVHSQGVGIGITQKATTPTARVSTGCIQATAEIKLGIPRARLATERVKTAQNAHFLAILHALGLASRTIKKQGVKSKPQIRHVKLICDSSKVVETVNHHIEHAPESYEDIAQVQGRRMVQKVVAGVNKLSRWGLKVSLVAAERNGQDKIAARARTLARQKGRKACRDRRRHLQLARNTVEGAAQDEE